MLYACDERLWHTTNASFCADALCRSISCTVRWPHYCCGRQCRYTFPTAASDAGYRPTWCFCDAGQSRKIVNSPHVAYRRISTHHASCTCIPASAATFPSTTQLGRQPVTTFLCPTTCMRNVLVPLCTCQLTRTCTHTHCFTHTRSSICCCFTNHAQSGDRSHDLSVCNHMYADCPCGLVHRALSMPICIYWAVARRCLGWI